MSDPKPKRPAPFCIRLSAAERAQLERDAGGLPLGAYVKSVLFDSSRSRSVRRVNRDILARLLALGGRSRVASNLQELADAARSGSLPLTPETRRDLDAAISAARAASQLIVKALGLRDAP